MARFDQKIDRPVQFPALVDPYGIDIILEPLEPIEHDDRPGAKNLLGHGRRDIVSKHQGAVDLVGGAVLQHLTQIRSRMGVNNQRLFSHCLNGLEQPVEEERVPKVAGAVDHHSHEVRPARDQTPGQNVGRVAEFGRDDLDSSPRLGRDRRTGREGARDGRARHARNRRHVLCGDHTDLGFRALTGPSLLVRMMPSVLNPSSSALA